MPSTSLFGLISARQHWLGARYSVLSQNLANADTPDYRPRDLTERSFTELLERARQPAGAGQPVRTHPRHLAAGPADAAEPRPDKSVPLEVAPSGNAVVVAEEMRKLGEIQRNFLLDVNLFAKYRKLYRAALGNAG